MESIVHHSLSRAKFINPTHLQMKNVKGRLGKVLRTKLLFALNPEDKLDVPKKGAVTIQKEIEDIRIILYTVQEKDTISSVAEKFNVSTLDIIFANQLYSNQTLYIGQVLYVYEDLTATNPTPENTTNIPNSPPTTNINPPGITSNPPSSNTTPVSSPTITALPPPSSSSFSAVITVPQEHQLVSLFPSSDAAVLDTMSSYRLLLPNLRAINDANLSKSAADSSVSSAIQSNTILQLAMKLNSNEFFEEVKERVVYVSSRENQLEAPGVLTATPRQIVFEPDWDSPLMEQGLLNYRIQMSINDIIDCHMIMESVPPPLYEMELQFYDEEDSDLGANKESYLQISVQSGIDPRVIRFIVPSEKLTSLYHKIMAWTGRPIHASRVAIPPLPLSAFSPPASVPSSVPNSNRNSPTMRSTPAPVMSESSLFSAATSKLRTMYQPDLSVIKERVSYITKIAKVRGVLTLTSNMVIFEPDLDDPTVVQHGLIANQINFFMADVYDCVFQNPTSTPSPPVSTSNPLDSPSWTLVDSNVSPEPRLIVTIRDGNGEKNVEFGTDKDKVDPIYAKITQHMGGRPKDKPRAPQSIASSPSLIPSASPPSPTHFSLASSPASNLFSSLKNSNILSKFSIPSLSRSNSDLTPIQPIDMIDDITPQQRMIQEIEDYDIRILPAPSNLITQERTKFLRRYLNSSLAFNDWKLLYSTEVHGISMNTMYAKTREKGPVFIVIEDTNRHVFGGYASESLHVSARYYGTGESFLFKLAPTYSVYPWPNSNSFFVLTTETFMSMGGGESGKYGFWVDADFQKGSSGFCNTFHNPPLSEKETFECLVLELT